MTKEKKPEVFGERGQENPFLLAHSSCSLVICAWFPNGHQVQSTQVILDKILWTTHFQLKWGSFLFIFGQKIWLGVAWCSRTDFIQATVEKNVVFQVGDNTSEGTNHTSWLELTFSHCTE